MKASIRGLAAWGAVALVAAAPAFAKDHGEGHGNGHGHGHGKGQDQHEERVDELRPGAYFRQEQRENAHRYYVEHYQRAGHCPPGLAKKGNGCMPPGQARKWAVGEPIPRGVVLYPVPQPMLVQFPPAPYGYHYARVGPDIVLVRNSNNIVIDIMLNVF